MLYRLGEVPIRRHTLTRDLNLFLPENELYFRRKMMENAKNLVGNHSRRKSLLHKTKGLCMVCQSPILNPMVAEVHHIHPRRLGGGDGNKNLLLLHKECHAQVTRTKNPQLQARFECEGIVSKGTYPKL